MEVRVFSCVLFLIFFYIRLILNELGDMKKVKVSIKINDFEQVSGIKTHIIRISKKGINFFHLKELIPTLKNTH